MSSSNNVVNMPIKDAEDIVNPSVPRDNGGTGDGGDMNTDKYVTHTELELSNEKLLRNLDEHFNRLEKKIDENKVDTDFKFEGVNTKFESINTKFEKQKVWFFVTAISIVTATCTIVGFLIKFL